MYGVDMMYIPYGRQSIDEHDIDEVVKVLKSDYITTGPMVDEFECELARYVGAKYAVAVSNGTTALHLACMALGLGQGDEVITSPITFVASANCVLYTGAKVVFADIDKYTYNIDPKDIERKITSRTKAIIPVHFTGQPCHMEAISKIARKYNLAVIEDGAHALGAKYKDKFIGSISDMTTFSFHPVKHITCGEGGMITTNNKELYERLRLYRTHGITKDKSLMSSCDGDWYYEQKELGFNYRISDIQCALGKSQLGKIDKFLARRRQIADRYNKAFKDIEGIVCPYQAEDCHNSYHLYVIKVDNRKAVFDKLREFDIGVNVHYIPVYKQPFYQASGYKGVVCPNAEDYYNHCISLPIYYDLSDDEQDYVIEKVIKSVKCTIS